jgi:hypothetical protein
MQSAQSLDYRINLFNGIKEGDLEKVKSSNKEVKNIQYVWNDEYQTPLYVAIQSALKHGLEDGKYLPIIKYLLCCGYGRYKPKKIDTLLEPISNLFGHVETRNEIRRYVAVSKCFAEIISCCDDADIPKQADPQDVLLKSAKMDRGFFNELVGSLLWDDMGQNNFLHYDDVQKRYLQHLHNFMEHPGGKDFLTVEIQERIRMLENNNESRPALKMM